MGYEDVSVQDCQIRLMRRVEPTEENNGFFAYERFINLDLLQNLSQAKVVDIQAEGATHVMLPLELDEMNDRAYRDVVSFAVWLRTEYPDAVWPARHPARQTIYSAIAEFELPRHLEHLETFSRYVTHSKFGAVTFVENGSLSIGFEDQNKLNELWANLAEYSIDAECAVEF